jgi:hypothetical protein
MEAQSIIIAVSSLSGALLAVGLQYLFGKALESRKQLLLQRSQSYVDFLKVVALVAQNGPSKENLAAAADAKTRICVYGSAEVIKSLSEFTATGSNTNSPIGRSKIIILVKEMRKNIGKIDRAIDEKELAVILFGVGPHADPG